MENVFVPLEVICRHHLAGSGWRRYAKGEVGAEEFGFEEGTVLEEGCKLPKPYLEVSTKFEAFDRLLDREEALQISNLTEEEFDSILECVLKIDAIIEKEAGARGLIHVDGKKEFALGPDRKPVLVDSFGFSKNFLGDWVFGPSRVTSVGSRDETRVAPGRESVTGGPRASSSVRFSARVRNSNARSRPCAPQSSQR